MSLKTPSRGERPLSLERLESRQMMSGTALTAMQQETVQAAGMVLRDDPVTLLSGEKEFNGSTVEVIADSPVFTDGSFMIEVSVRPNVIRGQTFVSKYDSQSAQDQGFYLGMYPDGRLQFSVYGNGGDYRLLNTTEAPLVVGKWQKIRASFDIQSQKMSITVDGREIPATIPAAASKEIRTIHDGSSPVRVGASGFGGGLQDFLSSGVKDVTFYPGEFGAKQEAAAVDAVIAEEEAIPETVTAEKQITAESIDAVLRAAPVTLLSGTKEFNGSTVEVIADSPVFTDGSFTIEATVKPDVIKSQTIVSKYDSRVGDKSFFLGMLGDGRLQFIVYGDNGVYRMYETPTAPLTVGTWQQIRASFDIDSQKMTIMIDGKEIPMTLVEGSQEVKTLHDGTSPVQVAASSFGGGPTNYWDGWIEDPTFYPVDRYGIPQQAVTVGAVIAEEEAVLPLTEAEALTAEQELTAEMVQTVLTNLLQTEAAPQTLTDTPDLGGATLQNGVLQIALPGLGGTASMMSWQGHAQGNEVKTITGAEGRQAAIAAGVIVEEQEIDTTPTLADVLALPEGIQRNQNGTLCAVTKSTQELGKVTVSVGDARRYTHLVSQNGMIGGEGSGWTFGQAGLSLTFVDGPRYVQWIDLKRLSGYTSVKVHIWNAQGAVRTVWASESGRLEINDTVSIMATYPEQQSSSWVIQAINTDPIVPPPAFEETWMQASGELVGLDLSDTDQAVQSVDMNVHSNQSANTIQAIACRGEERIATQAVAEDGTVHFESLEGITSVLFVQSDPTATLYVTSMSVSGLEGSVAPASTALSPMSNADVAKCGARQWEHGNFNPADVAVRSGVQMNRGGYENRVNGRMLFQSGIPVNSQTQYTRYTLTATSGSVGIAGLWYADSDGLHRVPQEYWELVAGNSVIIAPGAPKYIVIDVGGNGTFDVAMNTADHATDIVPSQEMQLRSSVVIVRKTGPAEGFCTVPPGVSSENAHATAGGTVNMFYQILNDGLGSGPITVKIHVGQTGSIADPVQKEFTGEIRGLTSIGLSADVTLTADNDIATMEVVGANGASTTVGQQVRPAHGSEGTGLSILQQAEHLARAGRQVAEALRGNNPTAR
ncbi:MAG: LamG-like jellyroll fold domain-containing protein, partial [Candidatus Peribacter sp.]|nr:LamG-like jellyroll fold domain-containing protein [Candidatus Peribacter sp.]